MSWISERELSSSGAKRRRIPMLARIRGSGAYQPSMAARSSAGTISSVSSSWFLRKVPHCAPLGISGVFRNVSIMGAAFWSRKA
ncbi:hypothetical protein D3C73_1308590 [compost metagenome]